MEKKGKKEVPQVPAVPQVPQSAIHSFNTLPGIDCLTWVTDKIGCVYSSMVRFICSELEGCVENGEKMFMLSGREHLDILGSQYGL